LNVGLRYPDTSLWQFFLEPPCAASESMNAHATTKASSCVGVECMRLWRETVFLLEHRSDSEFSRESSECRIHCRQWKVWRSSSMWIDNFTILPTVCQIFLEIYPQILPRDCENPWCFKSKRLVMLRKVEAEMQHFGCDQMIGDSADWRDLWCSAVQCLLSDSFEVLFTQRK
jgi:hypothetical protein